VGQALSVLDAQAVIAALTGESAAREVESLLRADEDPPSISAVNVAELIDVLVRGKGRGFDEVVERLAWLEVAGLEVIPVDGPIAQRAGDLRARHYDRATRPVSLADCVALATAITAHDRLATSDPALAATARAEGCLVIPLPDSRGKRP
jgi:predicted nucleic acid-binding protein